MKWGPCYLAIFNLPSTTPTCDQAKFELTVYISAIPCGILKLRYKIRNITLMHLSPHICHINQSQKRIEIHHIYSIFDMFRPARQTSWTDISEHTQKVLNSTYTNGSFPSLCGAIAKNGPRPSRTFEVSKSHTIRHTHGRTPLYEWSASRRGRASYLRGFYITHN
jgi:hypothetical protein